jgi:hypothetical protein
MEDDVPRQSYEYQWEPSLPFIGIFLFLVMGVLSLEVIVDSSRSVWFVFIEILVDYLEMRYTYTPLRYFWSMVYTVRIVLEYANANCRVPMFLPLSRVE